MLTATYSLVAITNEQNNTKRILHKLQQGIQNLQASLQRVDLNALKSMFNKLTQFDHHCRRRKVEAHLIPVIRNATTAAEPLLAELESISDAGRRMLRTVRQELCRALDEVREKAGTICASMQFYCQGLLTRLAREEEQLFPMAGRVLSVEEWFTVAAKFLSDDASPRKIPYFYGQQPRRLITHGATPRYVL